MNFTTNAQHMKWDTRLYDQRHDFVSKYGEDLIELLAPKEGELILDLGSGTGDLAALIKSKGAKVIGLDSSAAMVEAARAKYPNVQFDEKSADDFSYDQPFDAVFSNATFHWVLNAEKAVQCIHRSLKHGGRLVAEFGGKGNVANIVDALKSALAKQGHTAASDQQVWYFPSLSSYAALLEQNGFRVLQAFHFDRPTPLKEESGMQAWLQQFGQRYLQDLDKDTQAAMVKEVEARIRPTNFRDGTWYADYVRLRVLAIKQC